MAVTKASASGLTGSKFKDASAGTSKIAAIPDTPTIGTVTTTNANNPTVSIPFTPANRGGTANEFTAISTPGSLTANSASSPITLSGLTGTTNYNFEVRANNGSGSSSYSSSSNTVLTNSAYTLAQTFNASGTYTAPAGGGKLAAFVVGTGVSGNTPATGNNTNRFAGNGGRSSGGVAFKELTLVGSETFAITVGTTSSIFSNRTSTTLASTGASNSSNIAGAVTVSASNSVGNGAQTNNTNSSPSAGNAAGAGGGSLNLSETNITNISVGGPGGGGGAGGTINVNQTGTINGSAGGNGNSGGGAGGAGGNATSNSANFTGSRNSGGDAVASTGFGSGGGGGGSAGSNVNFGTGSSGAGGSGASGVVIIYVKAP